MLDSMIPLWESWLPFWNEYMIPLFCLGVVLFGVGFVRNLLRG